MRTFFGNIAAAVKGEKALGKTYWLYYFVGNIFATVCFFALIYFAIPLSTANDNLYFVLYGVIIVIATFTVYALGYGVIKSAKNRKPIGFWGYLACFLVIVGMIRFPIEIYKGFSTDASSIEEYRQQVTSLNIGLPRKIDSITTLNKITYDSAIITYIYSLRLNSFDLLNLSTVKNKAIKTICHNFATDFGTNKLSAVEFKYYIKAETKSFFISKTDCD